MITHVPGVFVRYNKTEDKLFWHFNIAMTVFRGMSSKPYTSPSFDSQELAIYHRDLTMFAFVKNGLRQPHQAKYINKEKLDDAVAHGALLHTHTQKYVDHWVNMLRDFNVKLEKPPISYAKKAQCFLICFPNLKAELSDEDLLAQIEAFEPTEEQLKKLGGLL